MFKGMQAPETRRSRQSDTYSKVFDHRKRRVRGLWSRHGRYFANITVGDDMGHKKQRFVPLNASSLEEAREDQSRLVTERADFQLRPMGMSPTMEEYLHNSYLPSLRASGKRPASIEKEQLQLEKWRKEIGKIRLNRLAPNHLDAVLVKLAQHKLSGRTVNLYLIAIRSLIKAAARDRHCQRPLPFEGLNWRRWDQKSRSLVTGEDVDQLIKVAIEELPKRGRELADYLRFLQYSGCREKEALSLRWSDVDWNRGIVTIGARGESKNRKPRHLPLNPTLESFLQELQTRRMADSDLLFPQYRSDEPPDSRGASFRTSLVKARAVAKLPRFGFHDLRHFFASHAVMSGIDLMTVSRWLGHRDGGVLVGRVYGHLAPGHEKVAAQKLRFSGVTAD